MKKRATKAQSGSMRNFLYILLLLTLGFLSFNLFTVFQNNDRDQKALQLAADVRTSSYRAVALSQEAVNGSQAAFVQLGALLDRMEASWAELEKIMGGEISGSSLADPGVILTRTRKNANTLLDNEERILFLHQIAQTLNNNLPRLQQEHTRVVERLLANNAPADQVAVAQAQSWRAEKVGRNIDKMLAGRSDAKAAAEQFNGDAKLFGRVLNGMRNGDDQLGVSQIGSPQAKESLARIAEQFEFVNSSINKIVEATPALFAARQATDAIFSDAPALQEKISVLVTDIEALPDQRQLNNKTLLIAAAVIVALLMLIGLSGYRGTRRSLRASADANAASQQAILRLLDEISDLADGDLRSYATVTEDFTGAIADSINYAIDQLRILVKRIQAASEAVSSAAYETSLTAEQLMGASQHQAEEIAGASQAVNEMAVTIDQVSSNASASAEVADRSESIAKAGSDAVQNTIKGMDTIREQIQDTSKRIKQLGESSQEIGDIVSLINDIAEQTNILALNAAIQASMAGDAGRGFAVVADEVQRLAERSAGATKQIASLVKTIQTDTNEAVSSMEQTTAEVVKGADLAQNAGVALEEIETVSSSLARLIRDISTAATQQSTTAGHISQTMNVIQDITSQTLSGTQKTADSIGTLADLAIDLKASVSGFHLPEEVFPGDALAEAGVELRELEESIASESESSADVPAMADDNQDQDALESDAQDSLEGETDLTRHPETEAPGAEAGDQQAADTKEQSKKKPMEALAEELARETGDWGKVEIDSSMSAADDDDFTIDVDELDLAGIEAELGLTLEDLKEGKAKAADPL